MGRVMMHGTQLIPRVCVSSAGPGPVVDVVLGCPLRPWDDGGHLRTVMRMGLPRGSTWPSRSLRARTGVWV